MMVIKFAYVGEFTSRHRRVGVGEFARRRVDRIPYTQLEKNSGSVERSCLNIFFRNLILQLLKLCIQLR